MYILQHYQLIQQNAEDNCMNITILNIISKNSLLVILFYNIL